MAEVPRPQASSLAVESSSSSAGRSQLGRDGGTGALAQGQCVVREPVGAAVPALSEIGQRARTAPAAEQAQRREPDACTEGGGRIIMRT
jgi:hypothetical protein